MSQKNQDKFQKRLKTNNLLLKMLGGMCFFKKSFHISPWKYHCVYFARSSMMLKFRIVQPALALCDLFFFGDYE